MATEEHLRFSSPIQNLYRYTRSDYDIAGVTIPRGSRVLLSFGAANRDPEAFEEPATYRADRNPRMHVGFGHGAHLCVGAPLARMEAHVVLTAHLGPEFGRASCRARVCQYVSLSVVADSLTKKNKKHL